jgi:hypothetical protein
MCPFFFHFLPQLLNRIVVRRIARPLEDRQALCVQGEEALQCGRRVLPGPILNQHDGWRGLFHDACEKGDVSLRVEPSFLALIPEPPGEGLDHAEDFVALAFAGCLDHRLGPAARPGVRACPPRREGGLIPDE